VLIRLTENDSMRDIVNDLNERLAAITSKYAEEMARYDEECRDAHSKHRSGDIHDK
jgi:hypothetical protein